MIPDLLVLPRCARCGGKRWICETHSEKPFPHAKNCPGPGEPCPACNTADPPRLSADWVSLIAADD